MVGLDRYLEGWGENQESSWLTSTGPDLQHIITYSHTDIEVSISQD